MKEIHLIFVVICSMFVGWEVGRLILSPQTMGLMNWIVLSVNTLSVLGNSYNIFRGS
jgi:hypothetical protein